MREIKFRAYRKKTTKTRPEKWIYSDRIGLALFWRFIQDEGDNLLVQEYTGLKSKNGKEIYEGDIAKFYSFMENKVKVSDVIFIKGCFEFRNSELVNEVLEEEIGIEIIGNIYENPELITNVQ